MRTNALHSISMFKQEEKEELTLYLDSKVASISVLTLMIVTISTPHTHTHSPRPAAITVYVKSSIYVSSMSLPSSCTPFSSPIHSFPFLSLFSSFLALSSPLHFLRYLILSSLLIIPLSRPSLLSTWVLASPVSCQGVLQGLRVNPSVSCTTHASRFSGSVNTNIRSH